MGPILFYNEGRSEATRRRARGVDKMDPDTLGREASIAGKNQQSVASRGHTASGNDHPEVASLAALERHPT
ncbi:hypothetical protein OPT61_g2438 [Boeremia exigua]|uniref:Uncharacterized protein n=1 Tax=Boeremia exigua TaxID=749465 RepID=A0ACC2ILY2_9PLEO|nr:hypothetical protein OPT61_g2438 [Boeremia exigua]